MQQTIFYNDPEGKRCCVCLPDIHAGYLSVTCVELLAWQLFDELGSFASVAAVQESALILARQRWAQDRVRKQLRTARAAIDELGQALLILQRSCTDVQYEAALRTLTVPKTISEHLIQKALEQIPEVHA